MSKISDERREVARKLREEGEIWHSSKSDPEWYDNRIDRCLGNHGLTFEGLADLIEPDEEDMCRDVSDDESVFECSRCGCAVSLCTAEVDVFENATYGPTLTMPNGREGELLFCPCCGARVTDGGEG